MDISLTQEAGSMDNTEQQRSIDQSSFTDAEIMSGLGPLLYKLPTELRLMIVGECVASGHLQFMRASQVLHNDGQALIFKKGVFRTSFGVANVDYDQYLSPATRQMIQNIDITLHMKLYNTTMLATKYWTTCAPSLTSLQHCEVTLKLSCVRRFTQRSFHAANPASFLICFKKAKKLVERVEIDKKMVEIDRKLKWTREILYCSCEDGIPCVKDCAVRMCELLQDGVGERYSVKAEGLCVTFERKKKIEM